MRINRIFILILVVAFITAAFSGCGKNTKKQHETVLTFTSFRDVPGITEEEIKAIEKLQEQTDSLIYAMTPSAEAFIAENNEIKGYSALFCNWLTELFGIKFKPVIYAWGDLLARLETGEVDFTGEMTATDERRKTFFMTDAIAERSLKYFRLTGSKPLSEIASERLPRYAILTDTTTVSDVTAVLGKNTFEAVLIDDSDMVYDLLKSGKIDAYINEGPEESIFDVYGDVLAENFFPLIYSPVSLTTQNPALKPVISVVQKILEKDGLRYLTELYNQGYHEYLMNKLYLQLTEEEQSYLKNHAVIPIVVEYDNYPVSFYNKYENKWQGMCFDVLNEIESFTGLHFEVKNGPTTEWPDLLKMLENGEAALISELIPSQDREERFIWPKTTIISDRTALISKSDFHNININEILYVKVGLAKNTAYAEFFNKWFPNHTNTVEYADSNAAINALERGEVDMMMTSQFKLLMITNYRELVGYKANIVFDEKVESTFGLNKNEYLLCSIIDKTLGLIDVDKISSSWISKTFDYNIKLIRTQQPWLIGTFVLLLLIISLLVIFVKKSRNTGKRLEDLVRNRTMELSKQQDLMYLVNDAAAFLLESETENITDTMVRGMEIIARRIEVDGIFIRQKYKQNDGKEYYKQVYIWTNNDFTNDNNRKQFDFLENVPRWIGTLYKNKCINGPTYNFPKSEQIFLTRYGIQSILIIPIFLRGDFWGFATFDDCHRQRTFPEGEVSTLRSWCLLAIGTLQRIDIAFNMEAVTKNYKGLIWAVNNDNVITTFKGRYINFLKPKSDYVEGKTLEKAPLNIMHNDLNEYVKKTFSEGSQDWITEINNKVFHSYTAPMYDDNGKIVGVVGSTDDVTETVNLQRALEDASRAKSAFLARMSHEIRTPMNAIIGMTELAMRENIPSTAHEHILTIRQAGTSLLSIINDILDFSKIETGKLDIIPTDYLLASLINDVVNIIKTKVLESRLRFIVNIDSNIPNALLGDVVRIRQVLLNLLSNAVKYTERGFVSMSIDGEMINHNIVILKIKVSDTGKGIKQEDIENLFTEFARFDMSSNVGIEGTGLGLVITSTLVKAMNGDIKVESIYGKGSIFTVTLPQKIRNHDRIATVENPGEKNVLIYERRELFIGSITETMDNLGVNYRLVTTESEFNNEIISKKYSFVFLASVLYKNIKKRYTKFTTTAKIVLIAEFGETIVDRNVHILTTPIFSIPIANSLNGVTDGFNYYSSHETIERFTAPNARVLVVDDITTNLKVAEGLLLPYKMNVDLCKNGITAIEMIKSEQYDLVFMDHMMPDMDGIEATARIRSFGNEDSYYNSLPIIALTANAVSGTKEMFYENGFDDFLPKPIDTMQLNSILEHWIPKEKQIGSTGKNREYNTVNEYESIRIDGINTKKGLAIARGSLKNYLETLAIFSKDGEEKIREIRTSLETDNLSLYTIHIHALKSACGNIGAQELFEAAENLEAAGKRRDTSFIQAHNKTFIADLETLLDKIHEVTEKTEDKTSIQDMELLKSALSGLKEALDEFDSVKIKKAVNKLREYTKISETGKTVEKILEYVLIGEYDEAAASIDSLWSTLC